MKRLITLAFILLFLTSCATQREQARTEGTLAGAGLGAIVGGGVGYLIGGSATSAGIGAALGALVGGTGGYVYADRIAKRQEELAGKEDNLDARIAFARGVNDDTQDYNRKLASDVKTLSSDVDKLAAQNKKQQAQNQQLLAKKEQLEEKVKDANAQLTVADTQLTDLKSFRSSQPRPSKDLDAEIKKLETSLAQLKSNTSALAALNQRI
jgi:uncharacterized protein YcfJ